MIPFNRPPYTGNEDQYVLEALHSDKMSGDGPFTKKCHDCFKEHLGCEKVLLTPSCTAALELAALLLEIQPGDEVIMPSYTFVSTANAFVLRGAQIVFVDIRPDTMNIDEKLIENAITDRTKVIVPVHYAGVACEMDTIMALADKHELFVVEDAAQGVMASYKGKPLGTLGHLGCFSFHDTKNYTAAGEGGLLSINDQRFVERAEILREKGTNRSRFFRGQVDKYSWVDMGSSFLPSDTQAAYLWGQMQKAKEINEARLKIWRQYHDAFKDFDKVEIQHIPNACAHNAHMFYIKLKDLNERGAMIDHLKAHDIGSVFHYVPLHSAEAGQKFGHFHGNDNFTTKDSERLLRLPMWYGLEHDAVAHIISNVKDFYR